jgi:hypothetical protein
VTGSPKNFPKLIPKFNPPKSAFFYNPGRHKMKHSLFRQILSAFLFIIVLSVVLWANYMLIDWSFRHVIMPFIHLFHGKKLAVKLLLIVGGGTIAFLAVFLIFMWAAGRVNKALDYIFIYNKVIYYVSILMVLISIAFSTIDMSTFLTWDLWAIITWLLTFYFVCQMNWRFVFTDRRKTEFEAGTYPLRN